ncbi:hypothetical protein K503DRAFT_38192 [Rhizopogon vinicolor AM-OR11-026]|uniref:Uncharacterized protein n=1 Tax=Rhizopogon vinicolor AM-OR11-026 TaxID=1314800 RepID=A0A1B7N582_9AGAM|nr:hypothetical protein K503DRAFT_38192 [Rhizopogon vinicolor AM-OR11-026]
MLVALESIQSFVRLTATHLPGSITLGCVTFVDATGYEHLIPVYLCTSFQVRLARMNSHLNETNHQILRRVNLILTNLFLCDSAEARIQKRYMEGKQYDLCIDEGMQVTRLTNQYDGWSRIESGTMIVIGVIIEQRTTSFEARYQSHFCGAWNDNVPSLGHSLQEQVDFLIDW